MPYSIWTGKPPPPHSSNLKSHYQKSQEVLGGNGNTALWFAYLQSERSSREISTYTTCSPLFSVSVAADFQIKWRHHKKKNSFNENRDWPECQVQPMRLHSLLLNQAWAVKESHNVEKSFLFQRSVEGDSSMPLPGTRNTVDSYSSGHPGGR